MHFLLAILLLMLPILVSGGVALRIPVKQQRLRLILAFSAAYLFSVAVMHMLPEAFDGGDFKQAGLFIVIGFCSQVIIDTFSTGIEHGHVHHHSHECAKKLPAGIIAGLLLHSFLEGLPVYDAHEDATGQVNYQLILGLGIHNLPITIAFVALLKDHESSKLRRIVLLLVFSLMSPAGFIVSDLLHTAGFNNFETYGRLAYAMVIGIFLHISTAILFESSEHHRYNIRKVIVMLGGVILAYFIS